MTLFRGIENIFHVFHRVMVIRVGVRRTIKASETRAVGVFPQLVPVMVMGFIYIMVICYTVMKNGFLFTKANFSRKLVMSYH